MDEIKSLKEFQEEKWKEHRKRQYSNNPHQNGIACPECGKELWDSCPSITLTSNPPQRNIHCVNCGYKGYRLA